MLIFYFNWISKYVFWSNSLFLKEKSKQKYIVKKASKQLEKILLNKLEVNMQWYLDGAMYNIHEMQHEKNALVHF